MNAAQAIPLTCHATGVIDADLSRSRRGIAEKGHLWTETGSLLSEPEGSKMQSTPKERDK
jgi:hypothetical protein